VALRSILADRLNSSRLERLPEQATAGQTCVVPGRNLVSFVLVLMLPAKRYVDDPALVERSGNAQRDRTWSGAQIDIDAVLSTVHAADPIVGLQLELARAFGLRRKEAVTFAPALAEVPKHALPANAVAGDYLAFARVKRGTKGGRIRYTAIRTDYQKEVMARARAIAPRAGMHVGRPGQSLKQADAPHVRVESPNAGRQPALRCDAAWTRRYDVGLPNIRALNRGRAE
jgi:hypothetical protein